MTTHITLYPDMLWVSLVRFFDRVEQQVFLGLHQISYSVMDRTFNKMWPVFQLRDKQDEEICFSLLCTSLNKQMRKK